MATSINAERERRKLRELLRQCEKELSGDSVVGLQDVEEINKLAQSFYQKLSTCKQQPLPPRSAQSSPKTSSVASEAKKEEEEEGGGERGVGEADKGEEEEGGDVLVKMVGRDALVPSKPSSFFASGAKTGARSAIFICKEEQEEEDEGDEGAFVAVMDVQDDEWWEIVNPEKDDFEPVPDDDFSKDSSYVMVEEEEVMTALASFVAAAIKQYPEAKEVDPQKLKRMIDDTLSTLQEKGTVTRAYEWGTFAYTTYGWGSYAWHLYRDPAMVQMVAKGVIKAGSWVMWLLL
jgi:hypothetical protein